jgi:hypothetical protein
MLSLVRKSYMPLIVIGTFLHLYVVRTWLLGNRGVKVSSQSFPRKMLYADSKLNGLVTRFLNHALRVQ